MPTITQILKRNHRNKEWYSLPEEKRLNIIKEKINSKKKDSRKDGSYYESRKDYLKLIRDATRMEFINMYGGVCVCCGETVYEFLTIDHIKGQKSRTTKSRESGFNSYRKAIAEYRPDLYRVLCMNCNHAIGRLGYCPHKNTNDNLMQDVILVV